MFKWFRKPKETPAPIIQPIISKITMGPKDILVFTMPEGIHPSQVDEYAQKILNVVTQTKTIDRDRVWVIQANLKISVLTPGTAEYELVVGNQCKP